MFGAFGWQLGIAIMKYLNIYKIPIEVKYDISAETLAKALSIASDQWNKEQIKEENNNE